MLQKYDKLKSSMLLAFAAAGGAIFAGSAMASEASCDLSNGYGMSVASYVAEASTCIENANTFDAQIANDIFDVVNADRVANGLAPLNRRASLDMAAQSHALDMSVRVYADHLDPEGRDHLHRIRAFDRTMLVGASGSNITVSKSASDALEVHNKIKQDAYSADNILRDSFTDIGIGVVEEAGQYYVVQVFAGAEGDLTEAIPVSANGTAPLRMDFASRDQRLLAWGLTDANSGEVLVRGSVPRVRYSSLDGADASLDVVVGQGTRSYVLKGPLVNGQN